MLFGAGLCTCPSASLAVTKAKVLLASFIRAVRFNWDTVNRPLGRITFHPRGGMPMQMTMLQQE